MSTVPTVPTTSTVLRPLSFWAALAIRQGAWWQVCKITRFWECVSPLGVLWWAWLLEQPGSLFRTNPGFADLARYAPEPTWGLWAGLIAGAGILAALLGPPTVRALAQISQMWLWTMIAVHLAAAAPRIPGLPRFLPFSTGAGIYALFAAASCVALAFLFPLVLNDALGCARRLWRFSCTLRRSRIGRRKEPRA